MEETFIHHEDKKARCRKCGAVKILVRTKKPEFNSNYWRYFMLPVKRCQHEWIKDDYEGVD